MTLEIIAMILAAMAVIIGLVVLLYEIGVSREHMILAALIAGLFLGTCIGCFGQMQQNAGALNSTSGAQNYFDSQDPRMNAYASGYHNADPYYTAQQTTTGGYRDIWGAMWNTLTALFGRSGGNGATPPRQQY